MNDSPRSPNFAPADPTDGRKLLEWGSKYTEPRAKRNIWLEAAYLAVLLFGVPITIVILWLDCPKNWFELPDEKYRPILKYGIAWLSGVLGGTLFDIKWLYHSVARQMWHLDRKLWRLFIPHISGGLAFIIVALISSPILRIFDRNAVESLSLVVSVAFIVGYFSDNALAKLREVATNLLGESVAKDEIRYGSKPKGSDSMSKE